MSLSEAEQTFRDVMTQDLPEAATPAELAYRDFVFGQVWPRARPEPEGSSVGDSDLRGCSGRSAAHR